MISRQRYKCICNNLLQSVKLLAHDEKDYEDFLKEQGITQEEVKEIEKLDNPIMSIINNYIDSEGLKDMDPFDNKMNNPICEN